MIEKFQKMDLKKYFLIAGFLGAFTLLSVGIWMYMREVPSMPLEPSIPVTSVPPSSVGDDKDPEFVDSLISTPLEPLLGEDPSSDIFIEVVEAPSQKPTPLENMSSPDFYFNQGVVHDQSGQKELAREAYEKALSLSATLPFRFSREALQRRVEFLKAS